MGTTKITQLIGTKKSCNLSEQKYHATSQDKKKSCNLSGQKKNHATSWDNKIMHYFGTKKHTTSRDKKIMQPLGTKRKHTSCWGKKNHVREAPPQKKIQKVNFFQKGGGGNPKVNISSN